ncbi:MAG: hypothetical protein J6T12_02500 [Salinivirgaceae bacterium]|nr:hypothetical protein [Salinivirgaceae bacterium]
MACGGARPSSRNQRTFYNALAMLKRGGSQGRPCFLFAEEIHKTDNSLTDKAFLFAQEIRTDCPYD